MEAPLHPIIVHFPIALTFILPILILVFAYMIKTKKMSHLAWLVIIGLQVATTASGYIALETGENEEHAVEKVLDKKYIQAHEESAEIFVGFTVLALVLSVGTYFLRTELQFVAQLVICAVTLISAYFAYNTGSLGGELVYRHGAAEAYTHKETSLNEAPQGILPTPGMNTSESPMPEENESLNPDENDYGNASEALSEEE
jgi:uncharacterized membrane protein